MKIAMPYNQGNVNEHFGISQEFIIFNVENGQIKGEKIISSAGRQHNHGGLASLFNQEGVDVVIAGGMGPPMLNALQASGLQVITGASGDAATVASDYLSGRLVTGATGCNHHCGGHEHHS